jgi:F-type H+-transporting ATPase subunit a
MPFIIIIEIISYIFRSISLALRLFANIVAGHILLDTLAVAIHKLLYPTYFTITNVFISIIPLLIIMMLICFETIVACLQAYIFLTLTCIYLKDVYQINHWWVHFFTKLIV